MIGRSSLARSCAHAWRVALGPTAKVGAGVLGTQACGGQVRSKATVSVTAVPHLARLSGCRDCLQPPEAHSAGWRRAPAAHGTARQSSSVGVASTKAKRTVALLPGNGVGPEVADAVVHMFDVAGAPIEWDLVTEYALPGPDGGEHVICDSALATIRRHGIALKGARVWNGWVHRGELTPPPATPATVLACQAHLEPRMASDTLRCIYNCERG